MGGEMKARQEPRPPKSVDWFAFEGGDFGADFFGDEDGALVGVVEHDNDVFALGGDGLMDGAIDEVGHLQAAAADARDAGAYEERVGEAKLSLKVALDGGEDRANAAVRRRIGQAGLAEI